MRSEDNIGEVDGSEHLQRIRNCSNTSPWSALRSIYEESGKSGNLGSLVASQVRQRIVDQGRPIYQGKESFCGPVSLEYAMALLKPTQYAAAMADLFCFGRTESIKAKDSNSLSASKKVLNCRRSSNKGADILFDLQSDAEDLPKHIFAADFIFAASLASSYNAMFDPCGLSLGQAQSPADLTAMAKGVFEQQSVNAVGGLWRHAGRMMTFRKHHFSSAEWGNRLIPTVEQGGQVLLTIRARLGGSLDAGFQGITDHWVVLTKVLRPADASSNAVGACAAEILGDTPACVVWTWGKYYVWESCDNLRKSAADAILLPPLEHRTVGPKAFQKSSRYLPKVEDFLIQMWRERSAGLHGLWRGSTIVGTDSQARQIVARTGNGGVTTDDGKRFRARDLRQAKVTHIALNSRAMNFGSGAGLIFVPKVLLGSKQQQTGLSDEDYESCKVI